MSFDPLFAAFGTIVMHTLAASGTTVTHTLAAFGSIVIHTLAAMAAFPVGIVQLAATKGTLPHRTLGWAWVAPMATVALSSLPIRTNRTVGPSSLIHALSILTLVPPPVAVPLPAPTASAPTGRG